MIYLDNAATTPVRPEALEAMLPYFDTKFGNASTVYALGHESREALKGSREKVASVLHAKASEVYFTSGGSESDNWALKSVFELRRADFAHPHIITSVIEHHAVLNACRGLESQGAEVTYLPVDAEGFVDPDEVEKNIRPETVLISVMMANNEIGTIQPIREIGEIAHRHHILFHTDSVQAFGQIPIDVQSMDIDLLSASSHKLGGPKGVGMLYIRDGISLPSLIHGGSQESGRRAGTENIPGIVGFAAAAQRALEHMDEQMQREAFLRDCMIREIRGTIPGCTLNGPDPLQAESEKPGSEGSGPEGTGSEKNGSEGTGSERSGFDWLGFQGKRLPGNVNFSFDGIESEELLVLLDKDGVCASSGSACSAGSVQPSHVLKAIGKSDAQAHSAVHFSIGILNTEDEIRTAVELLREDIEKLRAF